MVNDKVRIVIGKRRDDVNREWIFSGEANKSVHFNLVDINSA